MSTDIEALRARVDIVDFISRFVELKKDGAEFSACCPWHSEETPSFKVSRSKQIWFCFGCGQGDVFGNDVFGFARSWYDCTFPEAVEHVKNANGAGEAKPIIRPPLKKAPPRQMLVPPEGSMPDMEREDLGGAPAKIWTIRTPDGLPWFYECRWILNGTKETRFFTFGRYSESDVPRWECKGAGEKRPFYGLEELNAKPRAQVMITEAPKKADAGRILFPKLVHLAMIGGCYAPSHMDVTPLEGRRVILVPDADEAGRQAMRRLAPLLWAAGAAEVKGVDV